MVVYAAIMLIQNSTGQEKEWIKALLKNKNEQKKTLLLN